MRLDCNFLQMLLYKTSTLVPLTHIKNLTNEFWHSLFTKHWPEEEPHLDETINLLGMHYHYRFERCIPMGSDLYRDTRFRITEEKRDMIDKMAEDVHTAFVESGHV